MPIEVRRNARGECTRGEKDRMIGQCMRIYERIVERYRWDALAVFWPWSDPDGVRAAKRTFGDDILIGSIVGDTVWFIENVRDWDQFAVDLAEHPEVIRATAEEKHRKALAVFDKLADAGADYLSLGAACFQSVDPMAVMDIAAVTRRCHGRMALMGNVQCSLLQDGPQEAIRKSALYCLENAAPGGGYIFGTSNTIFPGMPLENYEYMLQVYREFCARGAGKHFGYAGNLQEGSN